MIATVYATDQTGSINNMSGLYYAIAEGIFWSNTSSSSDAMETEAHIFFDTTNANTGIGAGDTINSFKLVMDILQYENPIPSTAWEIYWGTGAGTTLDVGDWRVDSGNMGFFDPFGVGSGYEIPLIGVFARSNAFHIRIKTAATEPPTSNIGISYTAGVTPKLVIDYSPATSSTPSLLPLLKVG